MAIRIRLKVRSRLDPEHEVSTVALVNSGFEADTPQLLVPMGLAKALNLHQHLLEARIESYGTVAGPLRMYVLPSSTEVWIDEPNAPERTVVCDTLLSDTETEALISDYLAGELGIIALDFKNGTWRLKDDPPNTTRKTHPPQKW